MHSLTHMGAVALCCLTLAACSQQKQEAEQFGTDTAKKINQITHESASAIDATNQRTTDAIESLEASQPQQ